MVDSTKKLTAFNSAFWKQFAIHLLCPFSWLAVLRSFFKASTFPLEIPFSFPCQAPWGFEAVLDTVSKNRSILSAGRPVLGGKEQGLVKPANMQTFLSDCNYSPTEDFSSSLERSRYSLAACLSLATPGIFSFLCHAFAVSRFSWAYPLSEPLCCGN